MAYIALSVIRPALAVAARLSPRVAGKAAFRLFCRVPRIAASGKAAERERRMEQRLADATVIEVRYADIGRGGTGTVRAYRFGAEGVAGAAPRGTVLLIHGWTGRAAHMVLFVAPLIASGYDVVAVDLPGHGASSGRELHLPRAVAALHALHHETGPWAGIVAHSFGGAVALALIDGTVSGFAALPVERLVLVATPHSMRDVFDQGAAMLGMSGRARDHFDHQVLVLSGRSLSAFEARDILDRTRTATLILHAPDDREVSFASAEAIAASGAHVRLHPVPGLGHRRILYAPPVAEAAAAFVVGGRGPSAPKMTVVGRDALDAAA